ncbi:MAG TPA: DNA polymerase III subunit delta, partial [Acidimicrobiales bacterium]|nr:DNA polymerase III subunit delta [Acidimicrobiales bacterium]
MSPTRAGGAGPTQVYLVKGEDPSLVAQGVRELLTDAVGARDHGLVVEEVGGAPGEEINVGAVVDACLTPPFLIDRRVVVVRDVGRLAAADVPRLAEVIAEPLATTVLILASGGGTVPAALVKAVSAAGEVRDVSVGKSAQRKSWLSDHLHHAPVRLAPKAVQLLDDHLGEDLGRLEGLLNALANTYGPGALVSVEELEPYLGEAGTVPYWDLTGAIDQGDTARALALLHRMLEGGGEAPLTVLARLHWHFQDLLTLDGLAGVGDD